MPDETRHESADLEDYSVQEPADSLTGEPGEPGDDPLDRGVAPPERWSAVSVACESGTGCRSDSGTIGGWGDDVASLQ